MNWEGLKQPVKSGVGFREPPQKTYVFRGPRVMHLVSLSTFSISICLVYVSITGKDLQEFFAKNPFLFVSDMVK